MSISSPQYCTLGNSYYYNSLDYLSGDYTLPDDSYWDNSFVSGSGQLSTHIPSFVSSQNSNLYSSNPVQLNPSGLTYYEFGFTLNAFTPHNGVAHAANDPQIEYIMRLVGATTSPVTDIGIKCALNFMTLKANIGALEYETVPISIDRSSLPITIRYKVSGNQAFILVNDVVQQTVSYPIYTLISYATPLNFDFNCATGYTARNLDFSTLVSDIYVIAPTITSVNIPVGTCISSLVPLVTKPARNTSYRAYPRELREANLNRSVGVIFSEETYLRDQKYVGKKERKLVVYTDRRGNKITTTKTK